MIREHIENLWLFEKQYIYEDNDCALIKAGNIFYLVYWVKGSMQSSPAKNLKAVKDIIKTKKPPVTERFKDWINDTTRNA